MTKLNDDILASTGNTAKEQEMFFAGVEAGEANAKNNAEVRAAPAAPVSTVEQDEQPARLTDGYWWPTTASQLKRVAAELIRAADEMGAADDDDEEADLILSVVPTGAICLDDDDPEGRNLHPVLAVSIADYADEGAYPVDPLDPTGGRPEEAPAAGDALDAKRLDFLASRGAWVAWSRDGECCRVFHVDADGQDVPMCGWGSGKNWLTPREAIDAAIAAQQGKGGAA